MPNDQARQDLKRRARIRHLVRLLTMTGYAAVAGAVIMAFADGGVTASVWVSGCVGLACHALAIYLVPQGAKPDA